MLRERWNVHAEYFSLQSVGREEDYGQHYLGPGAHYLISPNMEIGTSVFWGFNEDSANFICNVGTGIRF
ncbi:transporter [Pirellulaceae bacterium SH501]